MFVSLRSFAFLSVIFLSSVARLQKSQKNSFQRGENREDNERSYFAYNYFVSLFLLHGYEGIVERVPRYFNNN